MAELTGIRGMTDYELIVNCLGGDNDCFTEIVARYKNLVYSIVYRMVTDRDEACDLAQDVFVKAYTNLSKYCADYKLSTWLMRITTNHVIDYRRKKKTDLVPLDEVDYEFAAPAEESPEAAYLRKEQRRMLTKVVGGLPDMYRIPIVLYHQQGLSYQEIAEITEEPLSKVKNRIFRGRKMLKETLIGLDMGGGLYGAY